MSGRRLFIFGDEAGGLPLTPDRRQKRHDVMEELRSHLGQSDFALAWSQGKVMTLNDATALVSG